ncbi:hypothetical protein Cme02nite_50860 [Catellatospora methionotrophica]|uniref:YdhG-like domain-containing protein n=1 Tax=Catellatospora methionotrophica TaxID=121620 RepID=A0A8J3LDT1_9ACTN|nr:DUF1801 domain-containing protein [Catellatospora methionotrophica]GIG16754.1 hypothetical protein Cme02nite_50860 [Catellatospora methionotrophica]
MDSYLTALPAAQREVTDTLTPLIDSVLPGRGALWHGHPVWSLGPKPGNTPVAYLKAHSTYVTFGLWRGQEISDPSGRLQPGARAMAAVKLRAPADIDPALFTAWLDQALALETR